MLCSVYTTIAGEYDGPGFCTPIGTVKKCVSNKYWHIDDFYIFTTTACSKYK